MNVYHNHAKMKAIVSIDSIAIYAIVHQALLEMNVKQVRIYYTLHQELIFTC